MSTPNTNSSAPSLLIIIHMGFSSNTMAATLLIPSMAIPIMILLLNPTISDAAINKTASEWCDGGLENCLVGDLNPDSEFLMGTESSRMLRKSIKFQTSNTYSPNKASVKSCGRLPRYDNCLGDKRVIKKPENCGIFNRGHPCPKLL